MMPTKRKVDKVGGGGSGGKEVVRVKKLKSGVPSTSGGGGDEINCDGRDEELENRRRRTEDWQALLAIFPEEVWILILESISDADILETLTNASPVFRDLLLPRRVHFLFPKVWDILAVKYHESTGDYYRDKAYREPSTYSTPLPWKRSTSKPEWETIQYTGIIKLRMVCRAWCDGVDNWYQNQEFRSRMFYEAPPQKWLSVTNILRIEFLSKNTFDVYLANRLERFTSHFEPTHCVDGVAIRNPFLGRAVCLYIGGRDAEGTQFLDRLRNLFLKYGTHIWYLVCASTWRPSSVNLASFVLKRQAGVLRPSTWRPVLASCVRQPGVLRPSTWRLSQRFIFTTSTRPSS